MQPARPTLCLLTRCHHNGPGCHLQRIKPFISSQQTENISDSPSSLCGLDESWHCLTAICWLLRTERRSGLYAKRLQQTWLMFCSWLRKTSGRLQPLPRGAHKTAYPCAATSWPGWRPREGSTGPAQREEEKGCTRLPTRWHLSMSNGERTLPPHPEPQSSRTATHPGVYFQNTEK